MTGTLSFQSRRVAVIGLARSGVAACRLLAARGADVLGLDVRPIEELGAAVAGLSRVGVSLARVGEADLSACDVIVLSPGVDPRQESLQRAKARGVWIVPELELGALLAKGRIVAVTGTKGKSTTVTVLAAMLKAAGRDARAVGNIGVPMTAEVDTSSDDTVFVVEASSFQLELTEGFDPRTVVFLNLLPDHLDRHRDFAEYGEAKARIFRNQKAGDTAIVNADSFEGLAYAARGAARILTFEGHRRSDEAPARADAFFGERDARLRTSGGDVILFPRDAIRVPGSHTSANLLAAAVAAHIEGASPEAIAEAVRNFTGIKDAFERLGDIRGVVFINDTKATTIDAAIAALSACDGPVIAILGGRLKAGSFASIRESAAGTRLKAVMAIGESEALVTAALSPLCPVTSCTSMDEAVDRAFALAAPGDLILLSPGCASFDMFPNYVARGDAFRSAFTRLKEAA